MKWRALLAAFALAAAAVLAGMPGAAPAQKARPPARDWTRTVVTTPEGGFRMGNPAARVRLVEYGSLTCVHCAAFSAAGKPPLLARYARTGRVSYEFRNYVLNGADVTATLLARCGGPASFFRVADRLYATQDQWIGRISGMSQAEKDRLAALDLGQRLGRIAEISGLTQLAAQGGVTPQRGKQCLSDEAALDRLGQMVEAAVNQHGIERTPTFLINGAKLGVNTWPAIEPLIRQAGG
jgi:protein-disulfide isomerase